MSSLGEFHHHDEEPKSSKITHWVILAVIVAMVGAYVVESGMLSPKPAAATQSFPRGL